MTPTGHGVLSSEPEIASDKPGMLASVGSILAGESINIAGLSLGRDNPGQRALTIINIDSPIPSGILKKLEQINGVHEVKVVKL